MKALKVCEFNVVKLFSNFSVTWHEKGIDPEVAECNTYLQNFCQDVLNKLKEMIHGKLCAKPAISNLSKPVQVYPNFFISYFN